MKYLVVDTETTGLNRRRAKLTEPDTLYENGDEVIQIGGIVLNEDLTPSRLFCHYCDCLLPESCKQAFEKHEIRMEDVRKYLSGVFFEEVAIKWIPELFADDAIYIGYNVDFDMRMIAQSSRNFCCDFESVGKVTTRMPRTGRWCLDVMQYLPKRAKLVSFYNQLTDARDEFYRQYAGKLPLETNIPELLEPTWQSAHNALFDSIETYLLFMSQVWNKKLFAGR